MPFSNRGTDPSATPPQSLSSPISCRSHGGGRGRIGPSTSMLPATLALSGGSGGAAAAAVVGSAAQRSDSIGSAGQTLGAVLRGRVVPAWAAGSNAASNNVSASVNGGADASIGAFSVLSAVPGGATGQFPPSLSLPEAAEEHSRREGRGTAPPVDSAAERNLMRDDATPIVTFIGGGGAVPTDTSVQQQRGVGARLSPSISGSIGPFGVVVGHRAGDQSLRRKSSVDVSTSFEVASAAAAAAQAAAAVGGIPHILFVSAAHNGGRRPNEGVEGRRRSKSYSYSHSRGHAPPSFVGAVVAAGGMVGPSPVSFALPPHSGASNGFLHGPETAFASVARACSAGSVHASTDDGGDYYGDADDVDYSRDEGAGEGEALIPSRATSRRQSGIGRARPATGSRRTHSNASNAPYSNSVSIPPSAVSPHHRHSGEGPPSMMASGGEEAPTAAPTAVGGDAESGFSFHIPSATVGGGSAVPHPAIGALQRQQRRQWGPSSTAAHLGGGTIVGVPAHAFAFANAVSSSSAASGGGIVVPSAVLPHLPEVAEGVPLHTSAALEATDEHAPLPMTYVEPMGTDFGGEDERGGGSPTRRLGRSQHALWAASTHSSAFAGHAAVAPPGVVPDAASASVSNPFGLSPTPLRSRSPAAAATCTATSFAGAGGSSPRSRLARRRSSSAPTPALPLPPTVSLNAAVAEYISMTGGGGESSSYRHAMETPVGFAAAAAIDGYALPPPPANEVRGSVAPTPTPITISPCGVFSARGDGGVSILPLPPSLPGTPQRRAAAVGSPTLRETTMKTPHCLYVASNPSSPLVVTRNSSNTQNDGSSGGGASARLLGADSSLHGSLNVRSIRGLTVTANAINDSMASHVYGGGGSPLAKRTVSRRAMAASLTASNAMASSFHLQRQRSGVSSFYADPHSAAPTEAEGENVSGDAQPPTAAAEEGVDLIFAGSIKAPHCPIAAEDAGATNEENEKVMDGDGGRADLFRGASSLQFSSVLEAATDTTDRSSVGFAANAMADTAIVEYLHVCAPPPAVTPQASGEAAADGPSPATPSVGDEGQRRTTPPPLATAEGEAMIAVVPSISAATTATTISTAQRLSDEANTPNTATGRDATPSQAMEGGIIALHVSSAHSLNPSSAKTKTVPALTIYSFGGGASGGADATAGDADGDGDGALCMLTSRPSNIPSGPPLASDDGAVEYGMPTPAGSVRGAKGILSSSLLGRGGGGGGGGGGGVADGFDVSSSSAGANTTSGNGAGLQSRQTSFGYGGTAVTASFAPHRYGFGGIGGGQQRSPAVAAVVANDSIVSRTSAVGSVSPRSASENPPRGSAPRGGNVLASVASYDVSPPLTTFRGISTAAAAPQGRRDVTSPGYYYMPHHSPTPLPHHNGYSPTPGTGSVAIAVDGAPLSPGSLPLYSELSSGAGAPIAIRGVGFGPNSVAASSMSLYQFNSPSPHYATMAVGGEVAGAQVLGAQRMNADFGGASSLRASPQPQGTQQRAGGPPPPLSAAAIGVGDAPERGRAMLLGSFGAAATPEHRPVASPLLSLAGGFSPSRRRLSRGLGALTGSPLMQGQQHGNIVGIVGHAANPNPNQWLHTSFMEDRMENSDGVLRNPNKVEAMLPAGGRRRAHSLDSAADFYASFVPLGCSVLPNGAIVVGGNNAALGTSGGYGFTPAAGSLIGFDGQQQQHQQQGTGGTASYGGGFYVGWNANASVRTLASPTPTIVHQRDPPPRSVFASYAGSHFANVSAHNHSQSHNQYSQWAGGGGFAGTHFLSHGADGTASPIPQIQSLHRSGAVTRTSSRLAGAGRSVGANAGATAALLPDPMASQSSAGGAYPLTGMGMGAGTDSGLSLHSSPLAPRQQSSFASSGRNPPAHPTTALSYVSSAAAAYHFHVSSTNGSANGQQPSSPTMLHRGGGGATSPARGVGAGARAHNIPPPLTIPIPPPPHQHQMGTLSRVSSIAGIDCGSPQLMGSIGGGGRGFSWLGAVDPTAAASPATPHPFVASAAAALPVPSVATSNSGAGASASGSGSGPSMRRQSAFLMASVLPSGGGGAATAAVPPHHHRTFSSAVSSPTAAAGPIGGAFPIPFAAGDGNDEAKGTTDFGPHRGVPLHAQQSSDGAAGAVFAVRPMLNSVPPDGRAHPFHHQQQQQQPSSLRTNSGTRAALSRTPPPPFLFAGTAQRSDEGGGAANNSAAEEATDGPPQQQQQQQSLIATSSASTMITTSASTASELSAAGSGHHQLPPQRHWPVLRRRQQQHPNAASAFPSPTASPQPQTQAVGPTSPSVTVSSPQRSPSSRPPAPPSLPPSASAVSSGGWAGHAHMRQFQRHPHSPIGAGPPLPPPPSANEWGGSSSDRHPSASGLVSPLPSTSMSQQQFRQQHFLTLPPGGSISSGFGGGGGGGASPLSRRSPAKVTIVHDDAEIANGPDGRRYVTRLDSGGGGGGGGGLQQRPHPHANATVAPMDMHDVGIVPPGSNGYPSGGGGGGGGSDPLGANSALSFSNSHPLVNSHSRSSSSSALRRGGGLVGFSPFRAGAGGGAASPLPNGVGVGGGNSSSSAAHTPTIIAAPRQQLHQQQQRYQEKGPASTAAGVGNSGDGGQRGVVLSNAALPPLAEGHVVVGAVDSPSSPHLETASPAVASGGMLRRSPIVAPLEVAPLEVAAVRPAAEAVGVEMTAVGGDVLIRATLASSSISGLFSEAPDFDADDDVDE